MVQQEGLPQFHPQTVLRDWKDGQAFRLSDAQTGVLVFGATGSGKTSGPAKHLAYGYLANGFGGVVLCAKKEERRQWEQWAADTGRTQDLVIIEAGGKWQFNFLEWEASRPEEGGGLTINIVGILDEVAGALANPGKTQEGGGGEKFWTDSLHYLNTRLVELAVLAGLELAFPTLREILNSAPQSLAQVADTVWQDKSLCYGSLQEADKLTMKGSPAMRADFEECKNYWLNEFPGLSDRTRSVIVLMFSTLAQPLLSRPLRELFCGRTTIKPEHTFDGKIIIVDLAVQEFRLAGRVANLIWKYCFQIGVLRRVQPEGRQSFLRPVFLWADECQQFISKFDAEYQAVARSAGGCTVYLTQNRESLLRVLGDDNSVDSLLGNLQAKFFCQNSGKTNEWAAKLLGERYLQINSVNVGQGQREAGGQAPGQNHTSGINRAEQKRHFVEESTFTTLRRGGEDHQFKVDCIVYKGGHLFPNPKGGPPLPYKLLTFKQS
jgi:hypothetical protein